MAKKPADEATEAKTNPDPAGESAPAKEKGPKKAKEGKEAKEPKAPKGEKGAPAAAAASPTPAPTAGPAAAGESGSSTSGGGNKKGKRPGKSPSRGKKLKNHLRNQRQKLAKDGVKPLGQAVGILKKLKRAKFDETVEIHMSLGVDATQSDQMIRGTVSLPHGIGKAVRVIVFSQGDNVAKAKEAGADDAGAAEMIKKIQDGWLEFDVALATQDMMGQVSRLGKVLGPRGLMPTPKAGTVITGDVATAVREFKAGKVEYRTDKGGNVHAGVGKISFDEDKLTANITAFIEQIRAVKPSGVKGNYIRSITVKSTMSPGIPVTA